MKDAVVDMRRVVDPVQTYVPDSVVARAAIGERSHVRLWVSEPAIHCVTVPTHPACKESRICRFGHMTSRRSPSWTNQRQGRHIAGYSQNPAIA